MKVLALGGAGEMGRAALEAAGQLGAWGQLTVADRDGRRAREVAARHPHARGVEIDASDPVALRALLDGHDVVLSTIGPYYRFGDAVLTAAIERGCHYVDLCDDWQPTLAMLERDEQAAAAGVTAIVGAGASPGITNMLALVAAGSLDEVDTLLTGWGGGPGGDDDDAAGNGEDAALEHLVMQCAGHIRVWADGAPADVAPLAPIAIDFPGVGRVTVRTVGHPEPVTLPRTIAGLRDSVNVMDLPSGIVAALRTEARAIDAGRRTVGESARRIAALEVDRISPLLPRYLFGTVRDAITRRRFLPELHATAIGRREGRPATVAATLTRGIPGGMAPMTGIPMAVVLSLLVSGKIERRGVFAPEAGVPPAEFFERLAPFCVAGSNDGGGPVALHSDDPELDGRWSAGAA